MKPGMPIHGRPSSAMRLAVPTMALRWSCMARKSEPRVRPVSATTRATSVKTLPTSNATIPCSRNGPRGAAMFTGLRICVPPTREWAMPGSSARHCVHRTAGFSTRVAPPRPMRTFSRWPSTRPVVLLRSPVMWCWPSPTSAATRLAPIPSASPILWLTTWASSPVVATTPRTSPPISDQTTNTPVVAIRFSGVRTASPAMTS